MSIVSSVIVLLLLLLLFYLLYSYFYYCIVISVVLSRAAGLNAMHPRIKETGICDGYHFGGPLI